MRGFALTLAGLFLFGASNAVAKSLIATYPVTEVLLVRSIAALLVVAPLLRRDDLRSLRQGGPALHALRMALSIGDVGCFYLGLGALPLADVSSFYLASPIYMTAMSALFLGERVGWRRWSAVLMGFCGVLVAMRPSAQGVLSWGALAPLAGSLCYAGVLVTTRRLRAARNPLLLGTQLVAVLLLGLGGSPFAWVPPGGEVVLRMALIGLLVLLGYALINRALQAAQASLLAPCQYSSIIWAIIFGWAAFGEVPRATTLAGAAIIAGAGLFIAAREHGAARAATG